MVQRWYRDSEVVVERVKNYFEGILIYHNYR